MISFLLFFLVSDLAYNHSKEQKLKEFHTYLQLNPPLVGGYDKDRFNVICLGGSTTEFKDSLKRDWPSMVETVLRDKYRFSNIKFYNVGRQWYSSQHILIHYIQNVRKFKPQAVIVMENINDLLHNADFSRFSASGFREDYGNFLGPLAKVIKFGSFSQLLIEVLRSIWYQKAPEEVVTDRFPGLEPYERNIRTLIALARQDGTMVILMTQPNIYKEAMSPGEMRALHMLNTEAIGNGRKWAYRTALSGIRQYNDRMRAIAASENVPLVDLENAVPKSLEYFSDDVHYKKPAYDLIADVLSEQLARILPGPEKGQGSTDGR